MGFQYECKKNPNTPNLHALQKERRKRKKTPIEGKSLILNQADLNYLDNVYFYITFITHL